MNIGDRVRVTKYERLGQRKNMVGRLGTYVRTHFAGWYVELDPIGKERAKREVLLLKDSDGIELA